MQSALLQVQEAVCNRYGLGVLAAWGRRAYAEMQEEGVYGGSRVYQVAVELNLRALSEEASPVELTEAHSRLRNGEWELSAYDRALRMRLIRYAEEDKILKAKWDAVVQEWRAAIDQEPEDEEPVLLEPREVDAEEGRPGVEEDRADDRPGDAQRPPVQPYEPGATVPACPGGSGGAI